MHGKNELILNLNESEGGNEEKSSSQNKKRFIYLLLISTPEFCSAIMCQKSRFPICSIDWKRKTFATLLALHIPFIDLEFWVRVKNYYAFSNEFYAFNLNFFVFFLAVLVRTCVLSRTYLSGVASWDGGSGGDLRGDLFITVQTKSRANKYLHHSQIRSATIRTY